MSEFTVKDKAAELFPQGNGSMEMPYSKTVHIGSNMNLFRDMSEVAAYVRKNQVWFRLSDVYTLCFDKGSQTVYYLKTKLDGEATIAVGALRAMGYTILPWPEKS